MRTANHIEGLYLPVALSTETFVDIVAELARIPQVLSESHSDRDGMIILSSMLIIIHLPLIP